MESADSSVSVDVLVKSPLSAGASTTQTSDV